jgi:hypothetical protein
MRKLGFSQRDNFHFHKLRRLALAKSFPIVEERILKSTVATERRNSLTALILL